MRKKQAPQDQSQENIGELTNAALNRQAGPVQSCCFWLRAVQARELLDITQKEAETAILKSLEIALMENETHRDEVSHFLPPAKVLCRQLLE